MSLHDAAKQGDLAAIGQCLSQDVDVNGVDKLQRTPLHLAAWAGQEVCLCATLSMTLCLLTLCAHLCRLIQKQCERIYGSLCAS